MKVFFKAIPLLLLITFFLQSFFGMQHFNPTSDEPYHLAAGYAYLKTGEIRLNQQHPPLAKELAALPLLVLQPKINLHDPNYVNSTRNEWQFAADFVYGNSADQLMFWSRLPIIVLGTLLGWFVYLWARRLYGARAGLLALTLYTFSPDFISHSHWVATDVALSCFFFMALYYFWDFSCTGSRISALLTGLSVGCALGSKFSGVVLLPLMILLSAIGLCLVRFRTPGSSNTELVGFQKRGKELLVIVLGVTIFAFFTLYSIYLFPPELDFYVDGLRKVNADHVSSHWYYLLGEFKQSRFWSYFLVAFLLKTPIPTLMLIGFALFIALRNPRTNFGWNELVLVGGIATIFIAATFKADNLGVRYVYPAYPFLFVMASRAIHVLSQNRLLAGFGVFLLAWLIREAVSIYPDHLSYFNQFAGGPAYGHLYLDDSNIDWGQDLKRLGKYVQENNITTIKLSFPFTDRAGYYGIRSLPIYQAEMLDTPPPGIYALSTQVLVRGALRERQGKLGADWLRRFQPKTRIGYGIWLYEFR